jgi:hypothetical protein
MSHLVELLFTNCTMMHGSTNVNYYKVAAALLAVHNASSITTVRR